MCCRSEHSVIHFHSGRFTTSQTTTNPLQGEHLSSHLQLAGRGRHYTVLQEACLAQPALQVRPTSLCKPQLPWGLRWCSASNVGDPDSIPGLGRSAGGGNGNPLQYPYQVNPMGRGAWQAAVHGVAKNWTQLSDWHFLCVNPAYAKCVKSSCTCRCCLRFAWAASALPVLILSSLFSLSCSPPTTLHVSAPLNSLWCPSLWLPVLDTFLYFKLSTVT